MAAIRDRIQGVTHSFRGAFWNIIRTESGRIGSMSLVSIAMIRRCFFKCWRLWYGDALMAATQLTLKLKPLKYRNWYPLFFADPKP